MLIMQDLPLEKKRVLIRQDLNVPLKNGVITDETRIQASLPTLKLALEAGSDVLVMSHLGRPKEGHFDSTLSLKPVAELLSQMLQMPVHLVNNWLAPSAKKQPQITLFENVRFLEGETSNDPALAQKMATLCDIYVNDAFGSAHRAHASTHGVAGLAPLAAAGPLLWQEVNAMHQVLKNPRRPLVAVVGGSKVSTKLKVIEFLAKKVDYLLLGGGIANTLLLAAGQSVGSSLCEPELIDTAQRLLSSNANTPLPIDVRTAENFSENATGIVKMSGEINESDLILDLGPRSLDAIENIIMRAGTILWNGPLGVFEFPEFAYGTERLAKSIARSEAFSLAGGGDTLAAVSKFGVKESISYISTGGGAFLEFLERGTLPAIQILEERENSPPF
jgi:phosphoglycerate kinase